MTRQCLMFCFGDGQLRSKTSARIRKYPATPDRKSALRTRKESFIEDNVERHWDSARLHLSVNTQTQKEGVYL